MLIGSSPSRATFCFNSQIPQTGTFDSLLVLSIIVLFHRVILAMQMRCIILIYRNKLESINNKNWRNSYVQYLCNKDVLTYNRNDRDEGVWLHIPCQGSAVAKNDIFRTSGESYFVRFPLRIIRRHDQSYLRIKSLSRVVR